MSLFSIEPPAFFGKKERLLNIGLKRLPADCDKIAWLDADILFMDDAWIAKTCRMLEHYAIVQPFSLVVYLPKDVHSLTTDKTPFPFLKYEMAVGRGYGTIHYGRKNILFHCHLAEKSGLAWAGRRDIFDKCGLYDRLILGSADELMGFGFYGKHKQTIREQSSPAMERDQASWISNIHSEIQGSVFYTHGVIAHLWHGSLIKRLYLSRRKVLKNHNFDPSQDIALDSQGGWSWSSEKPRLHAFIKDYLCHLRSERKANTFDFFRYYWYLKEWLYLFGRRARMKTTYTQRLMKKPSGAAIRILYSTLIPYKTLPVYSIPTKRSPRFPFYESAVSSIAKNFIGLRLLKLPSCRRPGNIVMIHAGRSGSSVLGNLLHQHSDIFWHREIYERYFRHLEAKGYLVHDLASLVDPITFLHRNMFRAGKRFYGFEFKFFHLTLFGVDLAVFIQNIRALGFSHFAVLKRENILRQIVSAMIIHERTRTHQPYDAKSILTPIYLDPQCIHIGRTEKSLKEHIVHFQQCFRDLEDILRQDHVLRLTYEDDIEADPQRGYHRFCTFLGLSPTPARVKLSKMNPFDLNKLIVNFDDVERELRKTPYAWMLDG